MKNLLFPGISAFMLSYRHSFHAGNHADVLKHAVQSLIIESLKEKEKPFLYLDTHAGAGRYQLNDGRVGCSGEYLQGIARIWQRDDLPAELEPYIGVVKHVNHNSQLGYYPGSPLIAGQMLRQQDSLHLTELHPGDFPLLRAEFQRDKRAFVTRADGYRQIKAKLPPFSRRGLIFIDPPYEIKTDYQAVITALSEGYKRFATGVYALWYPVVLRQRIKRMIHGLAATGMRRILRIELAVLPDSDRRGMTASGMIVVNPPWKLERQMSVVLPWLHRQLASSGYGHTVLDWIAAE